MTEDSTCEECGDPLQSTHQRDLGLCLDCARADGGQIKLGVYIDDPRIEEYITKGYRFANEDDFEQAMSKLQRGDAPIPVEELARALEEKWSEEVEKPDQ